MLSTSPILIWCFLAPPVLYKAFSFMRHIQAARRSGLPFTWSPIHELEIWAYFTNPLLRWMYSEYLMQDQGWPRWARFMIKDWMYEDKGRAHQEFGEVFLVVSPGGVICYISNAETTVSVCTRRKAFIKPPEKMKMLEPFGPNVVSTEGDLWRFHIRVTLPPFGDGVHRLVWTETLRQSNLLADSWVSHGSQSLKNDIYTLTVNVMSYVGFGKQAEWVDDRNAIPAGHHISLVSSIFGVVTNLPQILLLPRWLLKRVCGSVYDAYMELEKYMDELLAQEKAIIASAPHSESPARGNLLTAVLKSNSARRDEQEVIESSKSRTQLTDEEVKGNIFMFLLAGYDTTANTILYSSIILTLYSHIQDQIADEVTRVYREAQQAGRSELSFEEDLPKFRYLLAFMYEVIRVFPIVLPITRMAVQEGELVVDMSKHTLAPNTLVIVNITGVHYNERHWPHPHIIEPRRWLTSHPNMYDPLAPTSQQEEEIRQSRATIPSHTRGTFMTFNEGPRSCPGRRFAQVEFIAFFSRLLRGNRLKLGGSVSAAEAERQIRLRAGGSPVTLVPPEDVKVYLTPIAR